MFALNKNHCILKQFITYVYIQFCKFTFDNVAQIA